MKKLLALLFATAVAFPLVAMNAWSQDEEGFEAAEETTEQESAFEAAEDPVPIKRELKVIVEKPQPPVCSLTCEYKDPRTSNPRECNGREGSLAGMRAGQVRLKWNVSGETNEVTISKIGKVDPTGSLVVGQGAAGIYLGSSWTEFKLQATNSGGGQCEPASISARFSCFLKGTQVLMGDGTSKNIEDVKAGESVMSWDFEKQALVAAAVKETVKATSSQWYLVNENLKVSIGHQIYANGQWTWSEDLKTGDKLFDAGGNEVTITSLQVFPEIVDVFNLETDIPNNFFAENYLVHNENRGENSREKGLLKGTTITLADGRVIPIEQAKVGDKIFAYNFKKKSYVVSTIRSMNSQKVDGYVVINNKLKMAKQHPLYSVASKSKTK